MLRLDWNQLREIQGKEVAALSKLTQLDISNNQLEDLSVCYAAWVDLSC